MAYWNVKYCKICDVCKPNVTCENDFEHVVKEIRLKCADLLTDCWWGGKYFRCCDLFQPVNTEYGVCYSFNSALVGNASIFTMSKENSLPDLLFSATKVIDVTVQAPDDVLPVTFDKVLGTNSKINFISDLEAILKVEQTVNDGSVLSLPYSMRGCLFKEERPALQDWSFQRYTYSGCLLHCRRLAQTTACNCTHHFMSPIFGTPACDLHGLVCLSQNKDHILNYTCNCPTACDETQYKAVHIFLTRMSKSQEMIKRGTRVRIRFAQLPSLRVRRLAIKDTLGLVVDIGGVGGVFFGASLLSVMEIVYLIFIRRT